MLSRIAEFPWCLRVALLVFAAQMCNAQAPTDALHIAPNFSGQPSQAEQSAAITSRAVSTVPHPGDGRGAYASGNYRNLFKEQGHSPEETRAKIDKAFQQLFHGDALSERVYFEAGSNDNGPLAYITDWANNDARSEGMSYGMMIAVQMDKNRGRRAQLRMASSITQWRFCSPPTAGEMQRAYMTTRNRRSGY
jgi:hypothetical protein